jgi:hypothetical protein
VKRHEFVGKQKKKKKKKKKKGRMDGWMGKKEQRQTE